MRQQWKPFQSQYHFVFSCFWAWVVFSNFIKFKFQFRQTFCIFGVFFLARVAFCFHDSNNFCPGFTSTISLHALVQFHAKYSIASQTASLPLSICDTIIYVFLARVCLSYILLFSFCTSLGKVQKNIKKYDFFKAMCYQCWGKEKCWSFLV